MSQSAAAQAQRLASDAATTQSDTEQQSESALRSRSRSRSPYARFAHRMPHAGFPVRSGKVDIARLCHAGHEVAVVLQRGTGPKVERYLAQVRCCACIWLFVL